LWWKPKSFSFKQPFLFSAYIFGLPVIALLRPFLLLLMSLTTPLGDTFIWLTGLTLPETSQFLLDIRTATDAGEPDSSLAFAGVYQ
jgi:hypothetical protein